MSSQCDVPVGTNQSKRHTWLVDKSVLNESPNVINSLASSLLYEDTVISLKLSISCNLLITHNFLLSLYRVSFLHRKLLLITTYMCLFHTVCIMLQQICFLCRSEIFRCKETFLYIHTSHKIYDWLYNPSLKNFT